jgi:hypothetical protein
MTYRVRLRSFYVCFLYIFQAFESTEQITDRLKTNV